MYDFLHLMVVENEGLLSPISVSLPALQTVLNSHTTYYKQKHIRKTGVLEINKKYMLL